MFSTPSAVKKNNFMIIRLATNRDQDKWDEYVLSHPDASPYHLFAWKRAVEDAYKHKGIYLMADDDGVLKGVLPLVYLKPLLLTGQLVSLPFCDLGGVLSESKEIGELLISEAVSLVKKLKAKCIEFRNNTPTHETQVNGLQIMTQSHKVSMILELGKSSDLLWDSFKSKLRSQIRKAEKNGLQFIWGNKDQMNDFYQLFCQNMRDLGSPVHSKEWFNMIIWHYDHNAKLGLVYYDNKPIGGGIILVAGKKVCVSWASTLREHNKLSPNMLLYWNFLKYSADNGYNKFDFGRSTPDEGTYKFKLQWGSEPKPLYWDNMTINGRKTKQVTTQTSSKREKVEQLWQKLPLPVANYLGPSIRKYISL